MSSETGNNTERRSIWMRGLFETFDTGRLPFPFGAWPGPGDKAA